MTEPLEIVNAAFLDDLCRIIDDVSDLIVEHRHYKGASAPTRRVFSSVDELRDYVRAEGRYGDKFYVWHFETVCTDANIDRRAIVADANGSYPTSGAY